MARRDDLPPLERAVSDALDDINHRCHGLTSSWAYPAEFLEALRDAGYGVVSIDAQAAAARAENRLARVRSATDREPPPSAIYQGEGTVRPTDYEHGWHDALAVVLSALDGEETSNA